MLSAGYGYPASQKFYNAVSPQQDWLSSPVLSIPDWSNDTQPGDAFSASPISSPGVSTPSNGDSWNVFDECLTESMDSSSLSSPTMDSFGNAVLVYPQNNSQTTWNSTWSPEINSQGSASSYLPLSMIHDPSTTCDDEAGDETETGMHHYQASEAYKSPQSPRKAAWGSPKHTRRSSGSSKPDRYSSRTKRRDSSTQSETGISPSKGHQLRSTKQGQRIAYTENDSKNDTPKGARTSHNLVEKQYRTRLNGQFSTLLSSLPSDVVGNEVDGYGRVDSGSEKRVSKAEVLVLAKKHIENLERTKKSLECDKKLLMEDVQRLKGAWVKMGGDVLP